jgi:hypothetical protein
MKRRRKPLEISTFPFLAVLLCAMGSLILVLLVMDRKAKLGAREKAVSATLRAAADAEQQAAARRAELERLLQEKKAEQKAEWEKKREALHTKLITEQQALQLQMQQLREKMTLAAARLRMEQEQSGELKTQVEKGRETLQGETAALTATTQSADDAQKRTEQEKAALARMTNDLVVLERALRDLKEARDRERQTYSVVPYNGKRGESRRPLYIECSGKQVIFYPDKKPVEILGREEEVRLEVARHVARQRAQLAAAKMPVQQTPYLMLLVRPDGIFTYYAIQAALSGYDVQFGYELIDADWILDFPEENQPGTQPWQTLAKQPETEPLAPATANDRKVHGVQFHKELLGQEIASGQDGGATATPGTRASLPGGRGGGAGRANPNSPTAIGPPVTVEDGSNGSANGGGSGSGRRGSGGPVEPQLPWAIIAFGSPLPGRGSPIGSPGAEDGLAPRGGGSGSGGRGSGAPVEPQLPWAIIAFGSPLPGRGSSVGSPGAVQGASARGGGSGSSSAGGAAGEPQLPWAIIAFGSPLPSPGSGRVSGVSTSGSFGPGLDGRGVGSRTSPSGVNGGTGNTNAPPGQALAQGSPRRQEGDGPELQPSQSSSATGAPSGNVTATRSPNGNATPAAGDPNLPPLAANVSAKPSGNATAGSQDATAPQGPNDLNLPPLPSTNGSRAQAGNASGGSSGGIGGGSGEPGSGDVQTQDILRPLAATTANNSRPAPLRTAHLSGDRSYVIFIECKASSVVLYPSQREYPLTALTGATNPLVETVQQMIERKQSGVRPGDMPYRPQLRFLVRPETLRTYWSVYPLFDALPVQKTRHNLTPEEDVRTLVTGN